ncbi:hypothetical protein DFH08DRAFT_957530 [Mycena albidolilacea]|uniref:Uncharacterized protein n=1 Tax=Mycena albidolilacea TaxID=1033008 RepID=A0AAD7A835_9AGAR|nr:hypothetical protein DFH08DRAFT_957530 [Mycena albidolilacea]
MSSSPDRRQACSAQGHLSVCASPAHHGPSPCNPPLAVPPIPRSAAPSTSIAAAPLRLLPLSIASPTLRSLRYSTTHFIADFYLETKPHLFLSAETGSKSECLSPMLSPSRPIPFSVYSIPLILPPPSPCRRPPANVVLRPQQWSGSRLLVQPPRTASLLAHRPPRFRLPPISHTTTLVTTSIRRCASEACMPSRAAPRRTIVTPPRRRTTCASC